MDLVEKTKKKNIAQDTVRSVRHLQKCHRVASIHGQGSAQTAVAYRKDNPLLDINSNIDEEGFYFLFPHTSFTSARAGQFLVGVLHF